jgi:hypothetical protein
VAEPTPGTDVADVPALTSSSSQATTKSTSDAAEKRRIRPRLSFNVQPITSISFRHSFTYITYNYDGSKRQQRKQEESRIFHGEWSEGKNQTIITKEEEQPEHFINGPRAEEVAEIAGEEVATTQSIFAASPSRACSCWSSPNSASSRIAIHAM